MNKDLHELSDNQLDREFDRISKLRDEARESLRAIRAERHRRREQRVAEALAAYNASIGGA